ncbi:MAG: hypothetical protein OCC49_15385 [Fibrobacterales bacterium]
MPHTKLSHRDRVLNIKYANKRSENATIFGCDIQVRVKKTKGKGEEPEVTWSYSTENCPEHLKDTVTEKAKFKDDISAPKNDKDYHFKRFVMAPINNVTYHLKAAYPGQEAVAIKNVTAKQRYYLNLDITTEDNDFNKAIYSKVNSALSKVKDYFAPAGIEVLPGSKKVKEKTLTKGVQEVEKGTVIEKMMCRSQATVTVKKKEWYNVFKKYRFVIKKVNATTFEFKKLGVKTEVYNEPASCDTLESFNDEKLLDMFTIVDGYKMRLFLPESERATQFRLGDAITYNGEKVGGLKELYIGDKHLKGRDQQIGPSFAAAWEFESDNAIILDLRNAIYYPDNNPDGVADGSEFNVDVEVHRFEFGKELGGWNNGGMNILCATDDAMEGIAATIAHELGHGLNMVSPSATTYHTGQGGQGEHCTFGTTYDEAKDLRSPTNATTDICVMHWSTGQWKQMKSFCPECTMYLSKKELS